jgi:manganese efflux pump family protein
MNKLELLMIALGLAMDSFAVSLGAGAHERVRGLRPTFRLWFHFGLFQALLAIVGWFLGAGMAGLIDSWDHWVAFILLGLVGGKMVKEGLAGPPGEPAAEKEDPSRGLLMVSLSVATSLDALAVGISLGVLGVSIWYPGAVIGLVTALLSLLGLRIGQFLGRKLGSWMEVLGGVVLLLIALKILALG